MKTVEIKLSEQQFSILKKLSIENNKSISELVDIALEQLFSIQNECKTNLAKIQMAKGIWSDREDIGETDKYVREIRKGTNERMKRIGLWNNE
ncbi:hypothetical protein GF312_22620 [Candidatus Poribacteria bacterium]|nr:hypothetical protein [Candidatus Poribacteria bacterium]